MRIDRCRRALFFGLKMAVGYRDSSDVFSYATMKIPNRKNV